MIYTCYEMIQDCRADRAEGWSYFVSRYVPVMRKLAAHYFPERIAQSDCIEQVLRALRRPESSLFRSLEPSPERGFVAKLRQRVLAALEAAPSGQPAELELDLETLGKALEGFTVLEKEVVWLETMRYSPPQTGVLLRMDSRTVEKIREKAAERLRGHMNDWRRSLLADSGARLGLAAAAAETPDCLPAKAFLDVLDGRTTWRGREELEGHLTACWHCIDHYCRMAEVLELLRGLTPLAESEAASLLALLGIASAKKGGWRR